MHKNGWNVGAAKQHFTELLRRAESAPQRIYRRNRLVAAVFAVEETNVMAIAKRITIGDRFSEARELFRAENYRLPRTTR